MKFRVPLGEIIADFFDKLKSITKGYGSMDFELDGYQVADIKKLTISLMGEEGNFIIIVDALSFLVHKDKAERIGK
jgi:GTP-binding protein LepA